jgi:dolichol-phosphate mannosyltransferase
MLDEQKTDLDRSSATAADLRRQVRLSIVMPVFNERETILEALRRVRAVNWEKEIIVVDDASTDGTLDLLEAEPGITLVKHTDNQGKGMAIRTALAAATGGVIIVQDADLEYDPQDIPRLAEPIVRGEARVVYGSRFLRGRPMMRLPNYICNRLLALAANLLYGARITDEATCYKAFDASLLRSMQLDCRRFEFCPEVTARVRLRGERILEVPVSYHARSEDAGKKIRWWDAVSAFWTLLKYRVYRG